MRKFFGQVEHKLNLKLMVVGGITFISCQSRHPNGAFWQGDWPVRVTANGKKYISPNDTFKLK